ncbi:MAG: hypothetical protein KDA84_27680 [Planctomycetaceae bacterium]|nr:hypothetical protein [Planctomycetaceae bacterium]
MKPREWRERERLEGWTNNEAEWLECPVASSLLHRVLDLTNLNLGTNERRLRLFACACCRLVWPHLNTESQAAIEAAEKYADGVISEEELFAAKQPVCDWIDKTHPPGQNDRFRRTEYAEYFFALSASEISCAEDEGGWPYIERISEMPALIYRDLYPRVGIDEETAEAALCARLRDIYGNPFRKVEIDPAWKTPAIAEKAQWIYSNRNFDQMPLLADALVEAGCDSGELLQHCCEEHQHVLGCWALDSLLEKM